MHNLTLVRFEQVPVDAAVEVTAVVVFVGVPEVAVAPGMHCEYHLYYFGQPMRCVLV
jgi:hypothetical protein